MMPSSQTTGSQTVAGTQTSRIQIWLDAYLIEWFNTHKGDARGYQTAIDAALSRVVEEAERAKGG